MTVFNRSQLHLRWKLMQFFIFFDRIVPFFPISFVMGVKLILRIKMIET